MNKKLVFSFLPPKLINIILLIFLGGPFLVEIFSNANELGTTLRILFSLLLLYWQASQIWLSTGSRRKVIIVVEARRR